MSDRKPMSKKTRFEVFKRDNFTCQYCGAQSPDVVLHVDHINPVANGGENDILNLITACEPCNLGKGARELSDDTAIAKQRAQLEELNERREQLEMLVSWREGLAALDEQTVEAVERQFAEATGCGLSDSGRQNVRLWLKRFSVTEILSAMDGAMLTYFKGGDPVDDDRHNEIAAKAFSMIPRVANAQRRNQDKPWMKDLFYIRAIVRNRMYCNERKAIDLLEQVYELGGDLLDMQQWAKQANNWTNWRTEMEAWIIELSEGGEQ